jgi:hypothetical protein
VALGGGVQQAGAALARLLVAAMGKWLVVLVALVMVLGVWRLPPVPALVGLITGLLVHPLALYFDSNRTRFKGTV